MTDSHYPIVQIDPEEMEADPTQWVERSAGIVDIRVMIDGLQYDYTHSPRCNTCMIGDPWIHEINRVAVMGIMPSAIWRDMPDDAKAKTSLRSLRRHVDNHLGATALHHQAMISLFRSCVGISNIAHPDVVSAEMAARAILTTGVKGIMNGSIEVKTGDVLNAAKMIQGIEDRSAQKDQAVLFGEATSIIMQAARDSMSDDAYNALIWRLQSDERINEIMAIIRGDVSPDGYEDDDIVEAEVVAVQAIVSAPDLIGSGILI